MPGKIIILLFSLAQMPADTKTKNSHNVKISINHRNKEGVSTNSGRLVYTAQPDDYTKFQSVLDYNKNSEPIYSAGYFYQYSPQNRLTMIIGNFNVGSGFIPTTSQQSAAFYRSNTIKSHEVQVPFKGSCRPFTDLSGVAIYRSRSENTGYGFFSSIRNALIDSETNNIKKITSPLTPRHANKKLNYKNTLLLENGFVANLTITDFLKESIILYNRDFCNGDNFAEDLQTTLSLTSHFFWKYLQYSNQISFESLPFEKKLDQIPVFNILKIHANRAELEYINSCYLLNKPEITYNRSPITRSHSLNLAYHISNKLSLGGNFTQNNGLNTRSTLSMLKSYSLYLHFEPDKLSRINTQVSCKEYLSFDEQQIYKNYFKLGCERQLFGPYYLTVETVCYKNENSQVTSIVGVKFIRISKYNIEFELWGSSDPIRIPSQKTYLPKKSCLALISIGRKYRSFTFKTNSRLISQKKNFLEKSLELYCQYVF